MKLRFYASPLKSFVFSMDDLKQPLFISALQHYAYCPRQFTLIHVEQVWEDNFYTAHRNILHERVDSCEQEQRGNVHFERGLGKIY